MSNTLLIHHNNAPASMTIDKKIEFNYDNIKYANLDSYIHTKIIPEIKKNSPEIIFIKDNLSSNYLELYGLVVAYHIRLSQELEDTRYLPIVILSEIDACILNKLEPMANILFTKNIFLEPNTQETIDKYTQKKLAPLTEDEYSTFLDRIEVQAPENSSNHSIANEWAIYLWAKELKISNSEKINKITNDLSIKLYFKYLQQKYLITDAVQKIEDERKLASARKPIKKVEEEKRVLLIDDEWDKGWENIFNYVFPKNKNYDFKAIENVSYKDKSYEDIEEDIKKEIKVFNPDIVILDMRLVGSDHDKESDTSDISGLRILEAIKNSKELNPGTQVIMLTASGRSDILDIAHKKNKILGYIKKEHPEDINISTKDNIDKLKMLVDEGLKKKYLKEIWNIQKEILDLAILKKDDENFVKIKSEIETVFEILDSDLENKIKFTILTIFKILEILGEKENIENTEYLKNIRLFKIYSVKDYDTDISKLVCTRNFLIHSGNKEKLAKICTKNLIEKPTQEHVVTWFKMLRDILKAMDKGK